MSVVSTFARLFFGVMPGVDTVGGLTLRHGDPGCYDEARLLYGLTNGARWLKRIFEFTALFLCVTAILGSAIVPVPGLAPVTTLVSIGTLKMLGITWGYALGARLIGGCLGNVFDTVTRYKQFDSMRSNERVSTPESFSDSVTYFVRGLGRAILMGLFGELGVKPAVVTVISLSGRGAKMCSNSVISQSLPKNDGDSCSIDSDSGSSVPSNARHFLKRKYEGNLDAIDMNSSDSFSLRPR